MTALGEDKECCSRYLLVNPANTPCPSCLFVTRRHPPATDGDGWLGSWRKSSEVSCPSRRPLHGPCAQSAVDGTWSRGGSWAATRVETLRLGWRSTIRSSLGPPEGSFPRGASPVSCGRDGRMRWARRLGAEAVGLRQKELIVGISCSHFFLSFPVRCMCRHWSPWRHPPSHSKRFGPRWHFRHFNVTMSHCEQSLSAGCFPSAV